MVLKLYGISMAAGSTLAVAMALVEKDVPFELVPLDLRARAHKTPEFLAIQPFGQVPAIDDDGFILFETRAICRYLEQKYADRGTSLMPSYQDAQAMGRFEQAASIEMSHFQPHAYAIYFEGLSKPRKGVAKDQAVWDREVALLSEKFNVYEAILGKQKYLAGDEFSLVDLFHISFGWLLAPAGCDLLTTKGPNLARWWKAVTSRPSLKNLQLGEEIKSTAL
ncbi:glutathione S-transferase [Roridomyces roridus]|uniref:glutathione transferase n=1 Tax=Roridomyces roridus TaxID=1738132 RepID=A0AAD7FIF9_9AGAR|nr:glutathione S-transferase [Roridomyces roridus]